MYRLEYQVWASKCWKRFGTSTYPHYQRAKDQGKRMAEVELSWRRWRVVNDERGGQVWPPLKKRGKGGKYG